MKKSILYGALALSTVIGLASCSNQDVEAPVAGGNVNFTVELPAGMNTRSYSDGKTATQLNYYVYDEDSATPVCINGISGTVAFSDLKATVSLNLITGKLYSIVFWATAPGQNHYAYNTSDKSVTVSYENASAQDESRDAFYAYEAKFKVDKPVSKTITLTRPFAQINIGTTDWKKAVEANNGAAPITATGLKVTGVANKINLSTGDVEGEEEIAFDNYALPAVGEKFPYAAANVDGYLSMNYILVGSDKQTVDVTMTSTASPAKDDMVFSQVPVQRNYRTNIYGALLTNPLEYNVEIQPDYNAPDNNIKISLGAGEQSMPANIQDGAVIEGVEGTVLVCNNDKIEANNVTFKNVAFKGPGAENFTPASVIIKGNNITLDGCDFIESSGVKEGNGLWSSTIRIETPDNSTTTIKNCTFAENPTYRAILINTKNSTVNIENCTIDNCVYNITTQLATGTALNVKDSKISGWLSYNTIKEATFDNCEFFKGTAFPKWYYLRIYTTTTFKNCKIEKNDEPEFNNYGTGEFDTRLVNTKYSDGSSITAASCDDEDWNTNSTFWVDDVKIK